MKKTSDNNEQMTKVIPAQTEQPKRRTAQHKPIASDEAVKNSNKEIYHKINSYRKQAMTENEYWERIFYIHLKTKELYILAEEYGSELKTFFLPINSLKDAYENIIHICANDYMVRTGNGAPNKAYVLDNLKSALNNECKAFFDTADYFSILLRKKISESLNGFTYTQIASVWDGYNEVREKLININREISEIRNRKSDTPDFFMDENVEKYYNETRDLLNIYIYVEEKVYPKLERRFRDL